jgi:hypothetical protein
MKQTRQAVHAVKQATNLATNLGLGKKFFNSFPRNTLAYFQQDPVIQLREIITTIFCQ